MWFVKIWSLFDDNLLLVDKTGSLVGILLSNMFLECSCYFLCSSVILYGEQGIEGEGEKR